jgi:hypothetical protein
MIQFQNTEHLAIIYQAKRSKLKVYNNLNAIVLILFGSDFSPELQLYSSGNLHSRAQFQ